MENPTNKKRDKYIYITGLTAVGKTKLSIQLAKHLKTAEILNSDSQQFYKKANTMTATASLEEQDGVPHHLLSFLEVTEMNFNVNKFIIEAHRVLQQLKAENKIPIIVGGTNYYTESLIHSRKPSDPSKGPKIDPETPKTQIPKNQEKAKKSENSELKKRSYGQIEHQEIQGLLEEKNFEKMLNFYKKIEPEKVKLVLKNDIRKLENALKRLLNHSSSDYTWKAGDHDFIILVLDTENRDWIADRIRKRIREMVCEEGGLKEAFRVLYEILIFHYKNQTSKIGQNLLSFLPSLPEYTKSGVLQAIGYKEFIPVFTTSLEQILSFNPNFEKEGFDGVVELLDGKAEELIEGFDEVGGLLKPCVDKLASNTIKLTKKQRKWIKNRLFTNKELQERSFYFRVESKPQFFAEILPEAKNICDRFLGPESEGLGFEELLARINQQFSGRKHELLEKNEKTLFECGVCNVSIIGKKEKLIHLGSKKHRARARKKRKLEEKAKQAIESNKKADFVVVQQDKAKETADDQN